MRTRILLGSQNDEQIRTQRINKKMVREPRESMRRPISMSEY